MDVVELFVKKYINNPNVIGIIVSGSYANGSFSEHSDVDLRIITSEQTNDIYKGYELINDIPFSYLVGNLNSFSRRIYNQFLSMSKFEATFFAVGKVLYDKAGNINVLIAKAKEIINTDFDSPPPELLEAYKHSLFIQYSDFKRSSTDSILYSYNYFKFLEMSLQVYGNFLCVEIPQGQKLERILFDAKYQELNLFEKFPDQDFLSLWKDAVCENDRANYLKHIEKVYSYITEKAGKAADNLYVKLF